MWVNIFHHFITYANRCPHATTEQWDNLTTYNKRMKAIQTCKTIYESNQKKVDRIKEERRWNLQVCWISKKKQELLLLPSLMVFFSVPPLLSLDPSVMAAPWDFIFSLFFFLTFLRSSGDFGFSSWNSCELCIDLNMSCVLST